MQTNVMTECIYLCWKDRLKLNVSPEVDAACRFLESRGQRFLYDFVTENAWRKAIDLMEDEILEETPGICTDCGTHYTQPCPTYCESYFAWEFSRSEGK